MRASGRAWLPGDEQVGGHSGGVAGFTCVGDNGPSLGSGRIDEGDAGGGAAGFPQVGDGQPKGGPSGERSSVYALVQAALECGELGLDSAQHIMKTLRLGYQRGASHEELALIERHLVAAAISLAAEGKAQAGFGGDSGAPGGRTHSNAADEEGPKVGATLDRGDPITQSRRVLISALNEVRRESASEPAAEKEPWPDEGFGRAGSFEQGLSGVDQPSRSTGTARILSGSSVGGGRNLGHGETGLLGDGLGADQVGQLAKSWSLIIDPEGSAPKPEESMSKRYLSVGKDKGGVVSIRGEVIPEVAAQMTLLLDAYLNPRLARNGADGGKEAKSRDLRTPGQKRHDALAGVLEIAAGMKETHTPGGAPPTLVISMSSDQVGLESGVAFIEGAAPQIAAIGAGAAQLMTCGGRIMKVLTDRAGRIIELGNTQRVFTAHWALQGGAFACGMESQKFERRSGLTLMDHGPPGLAPLILNGSGLDQRIWDVRVMAQRTWALN